MEPIVHLKFEVEVFVRERDKDCLRNPESLEDIEYQMNYGLAIGDWHQSYAGYVPPEEISGHLIRIGNDGGFFDTDEDLNDNPGVVFNADEEDLPE